MELKLFNTRAPNHKFVKMNGRVNYSEHGIII